MKARVIRLRPDPIKRSTPTPPDTHCNRRRPDGHLCQNPAGARTNHLGQGRCWLHGGRANEQKLTHGWYSTITHQRVRETLARLSEMEINAMDLIPEANILRAMTIDYIERYEEFVDALMAWYADPESNTRPRRVMDISDAAHLIESISRVVQRMHQIQSEGAISLESFRRVTEQMGISVARHVTDTLVLNSIEKEWMGLAMDAKAPPRSSTVEQE